MHKLNFNKFQFGNRLYSAVKGLACVFFILGTSAFQSDTGYSDTEKDDKKLVTLHSDEFRSYTQQTYDALIYPSGSDTISKDLLGKALHGYTYLKHTQALGNEQYLTIIDFENFCNSKRMWVIDMVSKEIVFNELVAHGARSGNEYARYFSNSYSSNKSSLGFYTTGGLYYGRNNLSLKLNGLEKKFNSNAFARGIVIHGANYVSESIVNRDQRIGRSFGCPAVAQSVNKKLVNTIKGGSCLFIYHPTKDYLENSKILNAHLYLTTEELYL